MTDIRGAHLSECECYRYSLWRAWGKGPNAFNRLVFVGLNPSTADQTVNDATVRKWIGFAKRWGYFGFTAVNLFAYRATNPKDIPPIMSSVGMFNDVELEKCFKSALMIVPCWGRSDKLHRFLRYRVTDVAATLRNYHRKTYCLGFTNQGDPRHPLMLPYTTELVPWPKRPNIEELAS